MARLCEENRRQHLDASTTGEPSGSTFPWGGLLGGLVAKVGHLAGFQGKNGHADDVHTTCEDSRGIDPIAMQTMLSGLNSTARNLRSLGCLACDQANRLHVGEVREPVVDIFDEENHVLVLVTLPGVVQKNINLKKSDRRIDLTARHEETTYQKKIGLPPKCVMEQMNWEYRNDVLKIRFDR
jgi:HSP20 family protein